MRTPIGSGAGALLLALTLVTGCMQTGARPTAAGPPGGLAGTTWQLVEFQSMDDAQGTKRPDDQKKYTVSFGADGRAALRLDCNRAAGTWQSESRSSSEGSLEFGPLAMTRALCPPPSMGDMLAAQLPYVRSFVLRDGNLAMSLMADGGIIVWRPAVE